LNPTGGKDVCLLSKGVLPSVYVPLSVIRCNNPLHIQQVGYKKERTC